VCVCVCVCVCVSIRAFSLLLHTYMHIYPLPYTFTVRSDKTDRIDGYAKQLKGYIPLAAVGGVQQV
jgi:hypothetical protein